MTGIFRFAAGLLTLRTLNDLAVRSDDLLARLARPTQQK